MKISAALLTVAAVLAGITDVSAAYSCSSVDLSSPSNMAKAQAFCKVYLAITPKTVTSTSTITKATRTVTKATYTTTILPITPALTIKTGTTQTTVTAMTTAPSTTTTLYVTSTAYLDNAGNTIAIAKRDATHTELAARAAVTPSFYQGLSRSDMKSACQCLAIPTPTVTRKMTAALIATSTTVLQRKIIKTVTLPAPISSTTIVNVHTKVVTAAAPVSTIATLALDYVSGCPLTETASWLCPEGTGDDDGSDPNYEVCAVEAQDGFSGNCLYWSDDGSPAASTLTLGDGSGDGADDQTRDATYGDDTDSDCPSFADWTCSPTAPGSKRSTIVELSDLVERAKKPARKAKKVTKKHGALKKLPVPPPARGGHYIPYKSSALSS